VEPIHPGQREEVELAGLSIASGAQDTGPWNGGVLFVAPRITMVARHLRAWFCVLALFCAPASAALDAALVAQLGAEESDARVEAIRKLVATEDPRVVEIFRALETDALALIDDGKRAVIVTAGQLSDAATGAPDACTACHAGKPPAWAFAAKCGFSAPPK